MSHHWLKIALGRVCSQCSEAQATGAFKDDRVCPRDQRYVAPNTDLESRVPTEGLQERQRID